MSKKPFKLKLLNPEDKERAKGMQKMPFEQYQALVEQGAIVSWINFKKGVTIFLDPETNIFVYANKWSGRLRGCGIWAELYKEDKADI